MSISRTKAAAMGRAIAEALHECENTEQRRGVILVRDAMIEILASGNDPESISNYDWKRYCEFSKAFERRLDVLEPINPV